MSDEAWLQEMTDSGAIPHPAARDRKRAPEHTKPMTELTRPELDAKLEALEARMDARVSAIGGKIDAFLAAQAERDKATERRFEGIETNMAAMRTELREDMRSMKTTTIVTAISAVLAIVFGIGAFNATLTSNMLAAFQAGKGEASAPAVTAPPPVPPAPKP